MTTTTTNLPNQTGHQLGLGTKRMTLPLSGRSLPKGVRGVMRGAFALLLGLGAVQGARAATDVWTNNSTTNNLSNAVSKWSNSATVASGDSWVFANTTNETLTNNFAAGFVVAGITFNLGTGADIINGNSINLSGAIINNSFTNQTLNTAFVLQSSQTITTANNASSKLVLGGVISDGGLGYGLTFNGISGTTTLTNAETYTGATIVSGSTLVLTNGGSLANSALTVTNSGYVGGFTFTNAASTNALWVSSTNGLAVGQNIAGNGISNNVTITAITDANHITISANTTATANSSAVVGSAYTSAGIVSVNGATLTNVTVAGNGSANANATRAGGSAGSINFLAANTTINGILTIQGPSSAMAYWNGNGQAGTVSTNPYGYAQLGNGVTVTNVVVGGRLDITGTGSLSLSNVSGLTNVGQSFYAGNGSGVILYNNSYTNSGGNTINFASNAILGGFVVNSTTNQALTLTSGGGTVTLGAFQANGAGTYQSNNYTFSGGNWLLGQIGQGNSGQSAVGTNILTNNAYITVGTQNANSSGGTWVINGGSTMAFQTNAGTANGLVNQGQTFALDVEKNGTLNVAGSLSLFLTSKTNNGGTITNTLSFLTNNGGTVNVGGAVIVGAATVSTNNTNMISLSSNQTTIFSNNLTLGGNVTTNTIAGEQNTLTLNGGTLAVIGTLGAGTGTSESNSFQWKGGTLSVGTLYATTTNNWNGTTDITSSGLNNTNGNLFVGNTTNGYAGKTTINGNYSASGSATTTFNILGTNQASSWAGGTTNYSFLTNTGTATLGGVIVANFGSFTPATNNSFTLVGAAGGLSSTATLSGANVYNGYAFWNDGQNYSKLSTNATQLALVYGGLNQWQNGTGTWDATTNNWTAGVNPSGTNFAAYFGTNGAGGTITVSGNKTITALTLSNNTTGYTLNGSGTISLGNAGAANLSSYGTNAVNPNIALNGQMNITGTGALTLGGNISGNYGLVDSNTGSVTLGGSNSYVGTTLIGNGATLLASTTNSFGSSANWSNITVNGSTLALSFGNGAWDQTSLSSLLGKVNLTNNSTLSLDSSLGGGTLTTSLSGGYSLGVQGTGTITLTGNNSGLSNGVTLIGGTLMASSSNALGNTLVLKGGLLNLGGNTATFSTVAFNGNNFTVTNGSFSVTSGYTASNATVSQNLGGAATFTANGGTVILNGTNTYTGATLVSNGASLYSTFDSGTTYTVTNAGSTFVAGAAIDPNWTSARVASVLLNAGTTLAVDATGTNFLLNDSLTNGTSATLGTYGSGTLTLGGANNSAISALSVSSGTLAIGSASLNLTNLTISGGSLDLGGQSLAFNNNPSIVAGALKNGALTINNSQTFSTNLTLTNNASLNFLTNVTFAGNTASTISGSGTVTDTGYLYLTNSGNALTLNGGNYYFGRFNEGTTNTASNNSITITNGAYVSVATNNSGNGVYGLSVNSANSQVMIGGSNGSTNSILNLNGGRVNLNSSDSLVVNQGGVVTNAQLYLYANSTATLTNGGSFYGVTNYIVGRTGTNSSLNIGSANGSTSVLNGGSSTSQLNIGLSNSISNSVVVNQGGLITNVGYAIIGGTTASDITSSYNQLIITNGGVVRFSGTTNNILGYSTNDNSNSIVVTGTGSFLSQGGNLYVGYTNYGTNSGNNVQVLNGGVFSNSGTAITLDNTNSYMTVTGGTVYAKSIVLNNATTLLTLSNNGSTNGAIIALANGNLISGSGTVSLAGNGTISAGSYSVTNSAAITGPGTLTVNGGGATGTLTMAVSNSYTGGTIISSGTLAVNNLNVLGSGSLTDNGTLALSLSGTSQTMSQSVSGAGLLTISGGSLTLSGSNSFMVTNSLITAAVQVNSNAILSIASSNALTPNVTAYNPGGTNFSTNSARFIALGVTGGQVFFTNNGVTNTLWGGTNVASLNNGVATNIAVNENILITGTGNGVTNVVISNGATLVQYAPAGNQGTSFTLQSNAIMLIGSGGTYVDNLNNGNSANSFTIDKGGILQIAAGGVFTNTVYGGSFNLGSSAGMNYVTNAGTFYLSNGLAMAGGTNQFDNTGTFTLAAGNGFRMNSGVNTVNFLGGSTSTVIGFNEGGTAGNGTNAITIFSNAVVTSTGLVGVGYTGGVTNILAVNAGGTLNATGIGVSQAGSGMNGFLTNYGSISNSGGLSMNWQSGSNNNSTVMQSGGTFYNAGISYISGGNTNSGNGNTTNSTALLDVVGGVFSNASALNMGYQGVSNVNTFQVDGGTAYASSIAMGAGWTGALGGTNQITLNGGTLSTKQFTLGASNAVAGEVNMITFNGGTLLAASGASNNFLASGVAGVSISGTGTINDGGQSITIGASIANGSSAGQLIKAGAGTLTLSGVNTYSAGTLLNAGGLNITSASSLGAGNLSMSGGTRFAYTGIGPATLSNRINAAFYLNGGTIANSSGSALTLSGDLNVNGLGLTLAGGTFNVNGSFVGTGSYSLSNATANLSGLNTYSAPSSILAGSSLNLGGNDNLTTGSALNFGSTTDLSSQTNMLNLAGYNQTMASVANVGSGASQIIDSVGGGTFTLTGQSLFGGSIGGLTTTSAQRNLNLTIASGANVNLTGNNTYTGTTAIQNGATLDLGNGGSLSGSTNVNLNGGTLLLGGNGRTDSVNTNTALSLNGGTLSMGGTNATSRSASQTFASLTLTADSTIDFANLSGDSSITFANIVMNGNTLNIFDWSGTTFYGDQHSSTQDGTFTHLYDLSSLSASDLSHINFYAGNDTSSQFLGIGGFSGNEIVPVPEPGVIVAAIMLLGCLVFANRGMLIALINRRRVA